MSVLSLDFFEMFLLLISFQDGHEKYCSPSERKQKLLNLFDFAKMSYFWNVVFLLADLFSVCMFWSCGVDIGDHCYKLALPLALCLVGL